MRSVLPLRVTLTWTDPPGDPAAAIKLVNSLALVVTNLDDPANPVVYYGNDIGSGSIYNTPEGTNTPPIFDSINNVQNVYISPAAGHEFFRHRHRARRQRQCRHRADQQRRAGLRAGDFLRRGEVTNAITVTTNAGSFVSQCRRATGTSLFNRCGVHDHFGLDGPICGREFAAAGHEYDCVPATNFAGPKQLS